MEKKELKLALDFAKLVAKKDGSPLETHCRIADGYITATNGVLSCGHPLPTEHAEHWCPPAHKAGTAVNAIRGSYDIVRHDNGHVSIKSGARTRLLECVNPASIPYVRPDGEYTVEVPAELKACFKAMVPLIGSGEELLTTTMLLCPDVALVTDRVLFIEYRHGVALPGKIALTKPFLQLNNKVKAELVKIGVGQFEGQKSATFWYDDGSWIKTQLYAQEWMDMSNFLDSIDTSGCKDVPDELAGAVNFCADDVGENNALYIAPDGVRTCRMAAGGSSVRFDTGAAEQLCVSAQRLSTVLDFMDRLDFNTKGRVTFAKSDVIRGVIARMSDV